MEQVQIKHYSSSIGAVCVSINFKVKYCHEIFRYKPLKNFIVYLLEKTAKRYEQKFGLILHSKGIAEEHVHLVFQFGPHISVDKCVSLFKQATAYYAFKVFPWLRGRDVMNILGKGTQQKLFTKGEFWSGAYYFDSVGRNFEDKCAYAEANNFA